MSYPAFGKVKTIVLPCILEGRGEFITIQEYKNKFGIDLTEILYINGNRLELRANAQILLQPYLEDKEASALPYLNCLMPIMKYAISERTSVLAAEIDLMVVSDSENDYFGIIFRIPASAEMKLENVQVGYIAI